MGCGAEAEDQQQQQQEETLKRGGGGYGKKYDKVMEGLVGGWEERCGSREEEDRVEAWYCVV